ncbi:hypothetical protein TruAng_003068 [Truncatella angustata]|nr:hypothetical protein TruAng_003068 [Truncatella angustata]
MARSKAATATHGSSQPVSSVMDLLDEQRLPRSLFKIHKQQQELLDKSDSWAQHLSRRSRPGINIPPEVLKNLRDFHRRQAALTAIHKPQEPGGNEHESTRIDGNAPPHSSPSPGPLSDDEAEDEEDAGTSITWSPSPPRDDGVPPVAREPPPHSPTPDRHVQPTCEAAQQEPFISQIPPRSPLQPTMDAANTRQRSSFPDFPSSSLGSEADLEVAAPKAFAKASASLRKDVELNPTPPSAQIQVPCTFDAAAFIPQPRAEIPRSRPCSDLASIDTVFGRVATSTKAAVLKNMPPAPATISGYDIPGSQSSVDSASSVIPATNFAKPHRSPAKSLKMPQPTTTAVKETLRVNQPTVSESKKAETLTRSTKTTKTTELPAHVTTRTCRQRTPVYKPQSPRLVFSLPESDEPPFLRYCIAYPSYNGTLEDFLAGCLSIPKGRLATYQYDDFIRAWLEEYLSYVKRTDDALPCIDWYMDTAEELPTSFQTKVVTKANLEAILELYADDIESMRNTATRKNMRGSSESPAPALLPPENKEQKPGSSGLQEAKSSEGKVISQDDIESLIMTSNQETDKEVQPSGPLLEQPETVGEDERSSQHFAAGKDIRRSSQKRPTNPSVDEPVAKKALRTSQLPSEAGTAGKRSLAPRSSNPTKTLSKEGFKAFMKKKRKEGGKLRDDISIASSAPVRATPTSGQKG